MSAPRVYWRSIALDWIQSRAFASLDSEKRCIATAFPHGLRWQSNLNVHGLKADGEGATPQEALDDALAEVKRKIAAFEADTEGSS